MYHDFTSSACIKLDRALASYQLLIGHLTDKAGAAMELPVRASLCRVVKTLRTHSTFTALHVDVSCKRKYQISAGVLLALIRLTHMKANPLRSSIGPSTSMTPCAQQHMHGSYKDTPVYYAKTEEHKVQLAPQAHSKPLTRNLSQ